MTGANISDKHREIADIIISEHKGKSIKDATANTVEMVLISPIGNAVDGLRAVASLEEAKNPELTVALKELTEILEKNTAQIIDAQMSISSNIPNNYRAQYGKSFNQINPDKLSQYSEIRTIANETFPIIQEGLDRIEANADNIAKVAPALPNIQKHVNQQIASYVGLNDYLVKAKLESINKEVEILLEINPDINNIEDKFNKDFDKVRERRDLLDHRQRNKLEYFEGPSEEDYIADLKRNDLNISALTKALFSEIRDANDDLANDPEDTLALAKLRVFSEQEQELLEFFRSSYGNPDRFGEKNQGEQIFRDLREEVVGLRSLLSESTEPRGAHGNDTIEGSSGSDTLSNTASMGAEMDGVLNSVNQTSIALDALVEKFTGAKNSITTILTELASSLQEHLVQRFNEIAEAVSTPVETVINKFQDLYNTLVGNSIVPDMIIGIGEWFAKLHEKIVPGTQDAAKKAAELFKGLGSAVANTFKTLVQTGKLDLTELNDFFSGILDKIINKLLEVAIINPIDDWINEIFGVKTDQEEKQKDGGIVEPGGIVGNLFAPRDSKGCCCPCGTTGSPTDIITDLPSPTGEEGKESTNIFQKLYDKILKPILDGLSKLFEAILKPIGDLFSSLFSFIGGLFNANGNVFNHGALVPFARGGIVSSPTLFPMARGVGIMGEAGPEAIMPLRRGRGGRLGVEGAGEVNVNIHNNAGAEIKTRRRSTSRGTDIEVMIDQAAAGAIAKGGAMAKALENTFGLRPVPGTR